MNADSNQNTVIGSSGSPFTAAAIFVTIALLVVMAAIEIRSAEGVPVVLVVAFGVLALAAKLMTIAIVGRRKV
jgi:hypothetical protein